MASEKASVASIIKAASKKYELQIGSLDTVTSPVVGLPCGNLSIDHILGVGGLPRGRIAECYGKPSSGKSTYALQVAAELQHSIMEDKKPEHILYVDFEHAVDKNYARNLGLDLEDDSVIFLQPKSLEQGGQLARDLVDTGQMRLILWDSVAEALPDAVLAAETGQTQVAVRARIMSQFLQQINGSLFRNDCTALFLNHLQEKIPMNGYARVDTKNTPGGDALKFYSSVRMEFQQIGTTKGKRFNPLTNEMEDFPLSSDIKIKVTKNKVADPGKSATCRIRYGKGFDNFWSASQVLQGYKKVVKAGAYFYFDKLPELVHEEMERSGTNRPYVKGEDALMKFADNHPDWRKEAIRQAIATVANSEASEVDFDEEEEYSNRKAFDE